MFQFAQPYAFLLLLPAGVAIWFLYRRRVQKGLLFSATARISAEKSSWRVRAATALPILYILGLFLAIVALARPRTVFSISTHNAEVIAIEMVVDTSGSMQALDLTKGKVTQSNHQTRLHVVKETFANFIQKRPDDLIGLVTFGGYASTRAPLTADHEALLHVLSGVEIPQPGKGAAGQLLDQMELATAIGDGLATALARLEHADVASKIIVLLSDGESNAGIIKPDEAMVAAKELGIKVYTIGIGTSDAHPLVMGQDMFGRTRIARSRSRMGLDETALKKIADATDAKYFNVSDSEGLEDALEHINELAKTEIEHEVYNQYKEVFTRPLVPALLLIILATGLNMLISRRIV